MAHSESRRELLKKATMIGAGAVVGATAAPTIASAGQKVDPARGRLTAALADYVRHKFASHELAGEMKEIEEDIAGNLRGAETNFGIPIRNGDEPDFVFVPD